MKTYKVTTDFRSGVSHACEVVAENEEAAKVAAIRSARSYGFNGMWKKSTVIEVRDTSQSALMTTDLAALAGAT